MVTLFKIIGCCIIGLLFVVLVFIFKGTKSHTENAKISYQAVQNMYPNSIVTICPGYSYSQWIVYDSMGKNLLMIMTDADMSPVIREIKILPRFVSVK